MRRRDFLAGIGSTVAWPVATRAQQGAPLRRIGVLVPGDENDSLSKLQLPAFTRFLSQPAERYRFSLLILLTSNLEYHPQEPASSCCGRGTSVPLGLFRALMPGTYQTGGSSCAGLRLGLRSFS
jgi:hypothetical protein